MQNARSAALCILFVLFFFYCHASRTLSPLLPRAPNQARHDPQAAGAASAGFRVPAGDLRPSPAATLPSGHLVPHRLGAGDDGASRARVCKAGVRPRAAPHADAQRPESLPRLPPARLGVPQVGARSAADGRAAARHAAGDRLAVDLPTPRARDGHVRRAELASTRQVHARPHGARRRV